jgi:hypothetical protein
LTTCLEKHTKREEILKNMWKRIKGDLVLKKSNSPVKDCRIEQTDLFCVGLNGIMETR